MVVAETYSWAASSACCVLSSFTVSYNDGHAQLALVWLLYTRADTDKAAIT